LREANDRGFECLLAGDACGSGDVEAHRAALHMVTVEDGVFGAVADVAQIADALARLPQDIARATNLPPAPARSPAPPDSPEEPFLGDWSI
jgi:hypothetical protein